MQEFSYLTQEVIWSALFGLFMIFLVHFIYFWYLFFNGDKKY
jgi:hypothetical protein